MGLCIAKAVLKSPALKVQLEIVEPSANRRKILADQLDCAVVETLTVKPQQALLLAVKPQIAEPLLQTFKTDSGHLLMSIMAGIPLSLLKQFHPDCQAVRIMPNTPAAVGQGVSVYYGEVQPAVLEFVKSLLHSFGCTVEAQQEGMLDAATAISGSGPAYVFYFAEVLIEQAQKFGFSKADAKVLVFNTLLGSTNLMLNSDQEPSVLRAQVTSKQGTTEKALDTFEKQGFKQALQAGCQSAFLRAQELAQPNQKQSD